MMQRSLPAQLRYAQELLRLIAQFNQEQDKSNHIVAEINNSNDGSQLLITTSDDIININLDGQYINIDRFKGLPIEELIIQAIKNVEYEESLEDDDFFD